MTNTEKSRPRRQPGTGQAETGPTCKTTSTSETDSTMSAAGCLQISDFLLHGAENAVPRRYLETVTGLDGRNVRRRAGEIIRAAEAVEKPERK